MNLNGPRKVLVTCYALAVTALCTICVPLSAVVEQPRRIHVPEDDCWGPLWSRSPEAGVYLTPDVTKLVIILFALSVLAGILFALLGSLNIGRAASRTAASRPSWMRTQRAKLMLGISCLAICVYVSVYFIGKFHVERVIAERKQRATEAKYLIDKLIEALPSATPSPPAVRLDSALISESHRHMGLDLSKARPRRNPVITAKDRVRMSESWTI